MHYINGKLVFLLPVVECVYADLKENVLDGNFENKWFAEEFLPEHLELVEVIGRRINKNIAYEARYLRPCRQSNVVEPAPKMSGLLLAAKFGVVAIIPDLSEWTAGESAEYLIDMGCLI
jgi:hypothetical protein